MKNNDIRWLLQEKYSGEKNDAFYADCKRLALGEPLAYLIGHTPFLDCTIWLDSQPLIPRPETEFWTQKAIEVIRGSTTKSLGFDTPPLHILDLCAGSGCIGVAIAHTIPQAHVDFSEIEQDHITTIQKNIVQNTLRPERSRVFHTSLFENINATYDYIFSNPPYIDASLNRTDETVTAHEPHLALFGGQGGMEIISQIISTAPAYLNPSGQLWIEHEPEQSSRIFFLATEHNFRCTIHTDQYGTQRFSILVLQ